jgi:hypothetical protein
MGVIADFFARLLRMCPGRLLTGFLLIRQEVRAIFKTYNQLNVKEVVTLLVNSPRHPLFVDLFSAIYYKNDSIV